jgi:hypothetical protein
LPLKAIGESYGLFKKVNILLLLRNETNIGRAITTWEAIIIMKRNHEPINKTDTNKMKQQD